jgi:hypothetical protein
VRKIPSSLRALPAPNANGPLIIRWGAGTSSDVLRRSTIYGKLDKLDARLTSLEAIMANKLNVSLASLPPKD